MPSVLAASPPSPSSSDIAAFNNILEPVWKVYNLVKYVATAIAALFLLFAGITYMASGADMMKRENAKHTIAYVVLGLIVIWATPIVVQVFTS